MHDEGPSDADIERFSGETAHCPDCGAELWDQAEVCPSCFAYVGGATLSHPPARHAHRVRQKVIIIVTLLALVALSILWIM
jgi:hypothetical protein